MSPACRSRRGSAAGLPVTNVAEAMVAARQLRTLGARIAVITLGMNGCVVCDGSGDPQHIPSFSVTAVGTKAGGDAFAGALGFCLAQRQPILEASRFASTRHGAQPAMARFDEVIGLAAQK